MTDAIETFFNIGIQPILGFLVDADRDGVNRIVTGTSWSKTITIRLELGLPFGFSGQFEEHLRCSIEQRGNTQSALFRWGVGFGYPHSPDGSRFEVDAEPLDKTHPLLRGY